MILEALAQSGGRRQEAAARLGMSRTSLWRRMKELGLG
jgi:transcriptional regulator of acetoin/glycerol metabolism